MDVDSMRVPPEWVGTDRVCVVCKTFVGTWPAGVARPHQPAHLSCIIRHFETHREFGPALAVAVMETAQVLAAAKALPWDANALRPHQEVAYALERAAADLAMSALRYGLLESKAGAG